MSRFQDFQRDPFNFVDQINLMIRGNNLNIFQKFHRLQKIALYGSLACLVCWVIFGFDSTPLQFIHALYEGVPAMLQGGSWSDVVGIYNLYYGKEMHYSAFVIYFMLYWALSKTWEKVGVEKSKNVAFSCAGVFLAIAVFEFFWIYSFSYFQVQPWVSTWQMPQMKILIQNSVFLFTGLTCTLYMLTERYHWSWKGDQLIQGCRAYFFDARNWKLWFLVGLSVASALFWIYYPGHIQQITVQLENGETWMSSRLFPQTLYTVDLNPADQVNAGEWFWVENNWIHAVNTMVKVIWAITVYMIFRVKKNP